MLDTVRTKIRKPAAAICLLLSMCAVPLYGQTASRRSITIVTEPHATIWIGSVRYGTTNGSGRLTIRSVPAGRQTLRVRADGFAEVSKPLSPTLTGEIPIKMAPTTDEAWLAFQEGERQAGLDRAKAAEAYRKAIKLNPKLAPAHIGLARTLSDAGDHEAALTAIKALRRVAPRNAEASAIEGRIYKELDDEAKAITSFKRAIAEGGGHQPEAYAGIGLLYKEKAEGSADSDDPEVERAFGEASKNFSIAVKQLSGAPDAIVIMQLLGLIYERQKRYKEAISVYEDFLRTFPDSSEAEAVRSFIVQINKQLAEQ